MKMTAMKKNLENKSAPRHAFTLIELLVVISIIGVLAAFTLTVSGSVKRRQYISHTQAELALLETAIQRYHDTYGFYPPGNPADARFSPLYFELLGTANYTNGGIVYYQTLDGSASIAVSALASPSPLGVGGFINYTKPGSGEDAPAAKNFLPGLKPNQIGLNITNFAAPATGVALLLGSVGGPDAGYQPFNVPDENPWRYACPGTNNPNSYDLWIQLSISGKTNLVCNWSGQVQINSPLP
jgi:prepilin-type N-terminal cleavage/methylation domain-containing protein